ncbi:hypothetical protein EAH87_00445 [Sphingomonas koreensis]|nr:hypothetical protein EAH87_00445 [Sphingomonas koreensis]
MMLEAHIFRGEYLDTCAHIERWAITVIETPVAQATDQVGNRLPHLFGQKLKLVRELAQNDAVFARANRVRDLLDELEPFAKLRSALAHATCSATRDGESAIFAFDLPGAAAPPSMEGRFWLMREETARLIAQLKKIKKELADQKIKDVTPP